MTTLWASGAATTALLRNSGGLEQSTTPGEIVASMGIISMGIIAARIALEGPRGLFTDAARAAPRLITVAAGIVVTPI